MNGSRIAPVLWLVAGCSDSAAPPFAITGSASAEKAVAPSAASSVQPGAANEPEAGRPPVSSSEAPGGSLAAGRKFAAAERWREAMQAFGRACAEDPKSAIARSELGFAALRANDLDLASKATEEGLLLASEGFVRASLLYNQGRIFEERGEPDLALESYRASLKIRDHAEVQKRIRNLEKSGSVCREFATVKAACQCLVAHADTYQLAQGSSCSALSLEAGDNPNDRPLEVLELKGSNGEPTYVLLLDVRGRLVPSTTRLSGAGLKFLKITLPAPGKPALSSVIYQEERTERSLIKRTVYERFCAVPPLSKGADCNWAIPIAKSEREVGTAEPKESLILSRTLKNDGTVDIRRVSGPAKLLEGVPASSRYY